MTAVAEVAQRRFRAEIDAALADAPAGDPLARFRALGLAYLRWAMRNPVHSRSSRPAGISITDKAAGLSHDRAELIGLTERTMADAFAQGHLGPETGPDCRPRLGLRRGPIRSAERLSVQVYPTLRCGA
jgi:AcrR family transcriptional regulator